MPNSLPDISVIIATRNRLTSLKRCVESIRAQHYPKESMELVVVDDGSVDDTPGYLAALAAREPWVKVITRARGWQASARNKGIAVSRGELVAITDDDCTVAKEWLLTIALAMQDQDLSGIGGRVHAPGNHLIARYLDYVRALDPMLLPDGTPRNLVTANACFRRRALEQTGLFDETFGAVGGEDTELTLRMREGGMRLRFVPTCHVSHWYEPDIVAFLRRYYRYGFGNRLIFDKHLTWEQWLPHADAGLRALMSGHARWRKFHELEDTYLRPAYILLHTLQHFSYLAGYLHLTDIAQVDKLRRSDENDRHQSDTDATRAVSNEAHREQSEAILRTLSTSLTPIETAKSFAERELPDCPEHNSHSSPDAMLTRLDFNLVLEKAVPGGLPDVGPSVVDHALPEMQRTAYKAHSEQLQRAYTRLHRHLLRELLHQPGGITLTNIEKECYARSVDVNAFLAWYGKCFGKIKTHP